MAENESIMTKTKIKIYIGKKESCKKYPSYQTDDTSGIVIYAKNQGEAENTIERFLKPRVRKNFLRSINYASETVKALSIDKKVQNQLITDGVLIHICFTDNYGGVVCGLMDPVNLIFYVDFWEGVA